MKHNTLLAGLLLAALSTGQARAQFSLVNPVPQKIQLAQTDGALFAAPSAWNIKTDASRATSFAVAALKAQTSQIAVNAKAKFTVTLGVKGDKAVSKYASKVPSKAEGYWMSVTQKGIVVVGTDEEGLFYGIETLLASMKEGKLQEGTVQDWPDVAFRGTVEGFYGTPWSHEARLSQIEFYGRNKMNVYIYGPKDDPYHRAEWRKPYPDADAQRIKELNEHAKANGVKFYWAIHPGVDIKWTTEDRDALVAKLEKMYKLGIRSYAVFFDDIWGEGAKADKQAELLNYVDEHFIHKYKDVSPLIMCPTEYNRAWANDEKGYLRTLGTKMNKDVQIMWTGNSVVHCIDKESMEWINQRIDRKAYIWWNFPVSDFVRDHILLGPAYGNGLDIADDVSGFVSNPMEHAEASKISLYGIADYTWNMKNYDYQRDWERGLQAVLPSNTAALRTFALYSKDLGQNGHGFRREEGDELKSVAEGALKGDQQSLGMLLQKSMELKLACDVLLGDKSNPELVRELRPWLLQGRNLADYGVSVCSLVLAGNPPAGQQSYPSFADFYAQARSIQEQMYALENSSVRHALQPGIKVGTTVMLPTLNKLFTQAVDAYNAKNGTALVNSAEYNPYKLSSDVAQLNLLPVTVRGQRVSVAPSNEVINWQKDGSLLIEADRDITFAGMDFNLGVEGVAKDFKLELFSNGEWKTVSLLHYSETDPVIHTGNELGGMSASKLRLTNVSGHEMKVYFRSFNFVKQ